MKDFLIKKKSEINGIGIFTEKDMGNGEQFYIIPLDKVFKKSYPRYARIEKGRYVCDEKVLNFVNHSCNPNTILKINVESPVLLAKRNIKSGEEITCDYEMTEKKGYFFKCKCKSKNCRKNIGKL